MRQVTEASIKVRNYMTNMKVWAVISKTDTDVEIENFLSDEPDKVTFDMIRRFFGVREKANTILKPGMMMVYPRSIGRFVKYDSGNFMCPNKYVFATVAVEGEDGLEFKWNKARIRQNSDIVISESGNVKPVSHPTTFERNLKYFIYMFPAIIVSVVVKIVLGENLSQLVPCRRKNEGS